MAKLNLDQMKKMVAYTRGQVEEQFDKHPLEAAERGISRMMENPIKEIIESPNPQVGHSFLQLIIATTLMDYLVKRYEREGKLEAEVSEEQYVDLQEILTEGENNG
jgi:hypothetical protein